VVALVAIGLTAMMSGAVPRERAAGEPFRAVRAENRLMLSVGAGFLTFNEKIVLSPVGGIQNLQPGKPNLFHLLIPPLWMREGGVERPAFTTLRPYYSSTHGRVRRFALLRPDGERVLTTDQITPDCRYVLTLEFGHVIPAQFTVNVGFSSSRSINAEAEFLYTPSNDGYPVVSGPSESVLTDLHVNADAHLQRWQVVQDDREVAPVTPHLVRLAREMSHVIRFGQP